MISASISRRTALRLQLSLAFASGTTTTAAQQSDDKRPAVSTLQSGDFVWPKQPNQYVPFNSGASLSYAEEKAIWLSERKAFVAKVRANPSSTQEERQFVSDLEFLDFSEFVKLYQADLNPGSPQEFSGGVSPLYVGHVGVVIVEDGKVEIIEAVLGIGVQRISYSDWLAGRPDAWVWHGRISGKSRLDRGRIATEARQFVGTKYDFWNFDLSNTSGFYCSKLCWLTTHRALGLAIDGNSNPGRRFWFSPKQMLKANSIDKLFSPGSYTF